MADELILIYHEKCEPCNRLMQKINQVPKLNIKLVDYETDFQINIDIKTVPTLIVNNEKVLVGKECFLYFDSIIAPKAEVPVIEEEYTNPMDSMYNDKIGKLVHAEGAPND
jgi:hypothetical protein